MSTKTRATYKSIEEVVQGVELTKITTYEIHGILRQPDDGLSESQDMQAAFRFGDGHAEVRLRMSLVTPDASLLADIAAGYDCEGTFEGTDGEVVGDFVTKIGSMNVIPYLREALTTTASRLGVPAPILGLIRYGELGLEPQEEADSDMRQE
ncbi:hypothetical protein [Sinomonas sp. RB5]